MSDNSEKTCVMCQKSDKQIPLLQMSYNSKAYYICPEHMPLLIHQPDKLVGIIPGAENMQAG
jgi:hypothetical protein